MTDIFAVQDDVVAAIIDALQIHVGANPTRGRPTESTEAYSLFLKARASFNTYEDRDPAPFLLKAIDLDPNFAEAYELLAYVYWGQAGDVLQSVEGQQLMGEAAARALAIDPDLVFAQALYELGNLETYSFLGEIEAFERVARVQPGNPDALRVLSWSLLKAGYLREALTVTKRFVELDPLSSVAYYYLFSALYAVERTSEAVAALDFTLQLGNVFANWYFAAVNVVEKRDDSAITHLEAYVQLFDYADSSWVRELVTGARDPETGQAYLDRHIPQIVAAMPEEKAAEWQRYMLEWYLVFGFLDRYLEVILEYDLSDSRWPDADSLIYDGTIFRRLGFTAHPKYLEVAESIGMIDVWEHRGPPDFCEKVSGEWVCE